MADILKYGNAIRLAQLASDPSGATNGTMYYNTVSNAVRQFVNGGWKDVPQDLVGQALLENNIIVGDASNLSATLDTSAVGDILANSTGGLTIKAAVIVNADINASAAIDASKIGDGTVSSTEFQYINSLTSNAQTQLNAKAAAADVADLVTLSGVAVNSTSLGTFTGTIIPDSSTVKGALQSLETFIEAIPSPFYYAGVWAASTNTPTLDNTDVGMGGAVYYVTDSGTVNFGAGAQVFNAGDKVANNGTTWDKWDMTDSVISVNSQTGVVVLNTGDIAESGNLYFTDERAQDAIGTILVDTASVDLVYNDGTPSITATVLPAGVDHNSLLNYVANQHVDHTSVQIATAAATSGLAGGGTIAATRNLVVDINGTTAETVADNADAILIYDNSATALKKMTRANFLSGIAITSAGDIAETSFTTLANNTANQSITGFAFNNATVRSFQALVSVFIDATADSYANYELRGVQRGADWALVQSYNGDDITGFEFNITSGGQVQASIGNITGFSASKISFRAITTTV